MLARSDLQRGANAEWVESPDELQMPGELRRWLEELATGLAEVSRRQEQLQDLIWQTREQLLRRDDEIQATLYELGASLAPGSKLALESLEQRGEPLLSRSWHASMYGELIERIRDLVASAVPAGSTVVVASRGDDRLLELGHAHGVHFPQAPDGIYAGFHPTDSGFAIQHLEDLRSRGGEYFLLPATAAWWLDFYPGFRDHLEQNCTLLARDQNTCLLYNLRSQRQK